MSALSASNVSSANIRTDYVNKDSGKDEGKDRSLHGTPELRFDVAETCVETLRSNLSSYFQELWGMETSVGSAFSYAK